MSTTDATTSSTGLPVGTWNLDPVHSSANFAVRHFEVGNFRGRFDTFEATLTVDEDSAELVGKVDAGSIVVKDPNLQGHLGSPDFFDLERFPEITFRSTQIRREGDQVELDGELTIKGNSQPVHARGTIYGPTVTLGDVTKIGLELEAVVDKNEFGLTWNAPLPKGGVVLADEVKLNVELELLQS
jgi:polyisoprenoid-binding protein YceI